jgi:hypothetical protein
MSSFVQHLVAHMVRGSKEKRKRKQVFNLNWLLLCFGYSFVPYRLFLMVIWFELITWKLVGKCSLSCLFFFFCFHFCFKIGSHIFVQGWFISSYLQLPHCWNDSSAPPSTDLFWDGVSLSFCLGWSGNEIHPISTSRVAGITVLSYHTLL